MNDDIFNTPQTSLAKRKVLTRSDSEESISKIEDRGNEDRSLKRKYSKSVRCNDELQQLNFRIKQIHNDVEKYFKRLSKKMKGMKNSILYDLNKKGEAVKSTIAINLASAPGES
ncbi:hypothetical protein PUN28_012762 [Cardiocondyla obscurior]|uniref:Uncharacterized protein n=1 Tax=Cardiocondyla obscurior TaxID=286306 RepID=A0AAW2F8R1_9HYME